MCVSAQGFVPHLSIKCNCHSFKYQLSLRLVTILFLSGKVSGCLVISKLIMGLVSQIVAFRMKLDKATR